MLCQAILPDGSDCKNLSKLVTDEGIYTCFKHKDFNLSKKDHILKMIEEDEFNNQRKEFIDSLNRELLDNHEFDIPLKNKFGLIVDFAFVSKSDFEEVNKYKWYKTKGYAAKDYTQETESLMHRYLLGKQDDGFVIDHIDNNRLNNRRENLRFVTESENAQNKPKIIRENTTSKYIGVHLKRSKWTAQYSTKYLGTFENEIDAAKVYDTYILLKFGQDAKTNNLVKYNEITKTLNDFEFNKPIRNLPSNIKVQNGLYIISKTYNGTNFYKSTRVLEEAEKILEEVNVKISKLKVQEEADHLVKEIKRNSDGLAIIEIFNKNLEKIQDVIVDDDKWHELIKYRWSKSGIYYQQAQINGIKTLLHRYLLKHQKGDIVDHINRNTFDNRLQNLRIVNISINSHNRFGRGKSLFKGVSFKTKENKWISSVVKDRIRYSTGSYEKEIQAAIAVNIKSKEIYGEYASLNTISEEDLNENLSIVEAKLQFLSDLQNKKKLQPKKKYKGTKQKLNNKWSACIKYDYKNHYIGTFESEVEAALAYNKKAIEFLGNKAKLNAV
jgi:hypothetical protein